MNTNNLNEIMQKEFDTFCQSGKIEKLFQENIEKTISSIISDQFNYSGNIKKALEEKVKSDLKIDLSEISLAEHSLKITQTIKNSLDKYFSNETKSIKERITKELDYDHKEIKLSEIVDKFKNKFKRELDKNYDDEMTVIVDESDSVNGYFHIYIGSDCEMSKFSCEAQIAFKKDGVWNVSYRDSDIKKDAVFSLSWEPETFLYKLYANKTKIIIDQYVHYYGEEE